MKRRWQPRARQSRCAPVTVDDLDGQLRLQLHVRLGADAPQKAKRLVVTADEDVLPVVDAFSGRRIRECGGASSQGRACFEYEHALSRFGKGSGRAQSREAGAENNDLTAHGARARAPEATDASRGPHGTVAARGSDG